MPARTTAAPASPYRRRLRSESRARIDAGQGNGDAIGARARADASAEASVRISGCLGSSSGARLSSGSGARLSSGSSARLSSGSRLGSSSGACLNPGVVRRPGAQIAARRARTDGSSATAGAHATCAADATCATVCVGAAPDSHAHAQKPHRGACDQKCLHGFLLSPTTDAMAARTGAGCVPGGCAVITPECVEKAQRLSRLERARTTSRVPRPSSFLGSAPSRRGSLLE
jgi:hypothetical protein